MRNIFLHITLIIAIFAIISCTDKENDVKISVSMKNIDAVLQCSDTIKDCYGICSHITRKAVDYPYIDDILDLMEDLHITWVRSDLDWYSVSASPESELDYALFDDVFTHLENHPNIHLLPIIVPENNKYKQIDDEVLTCKSYHEQWTKYIKGIISRYKNNCMVWEGFNEWDQYLNKGIMTYDEGVEFEKEIYEATKECDPNLKVLAGCISTIDPTYKNLSDKGFYTYCDINNQHSYVSKGPESIYIQWTDIISDIDKKYNTKNPLWLTEFGYSTSVNYGTEEEQAIYIPRTYITSFAKGVEKVFVYSMRSKEYEGHEYDKESYFGITYKDLSPKPAYYSLRNLTRMLPSGSVRPKLQQLGRLYLAYWIHPQLGKVYAIWTEKDKQTISLDIEGTPHFYSYNDIDNELQIENVNNFDVGPGAIYITGVTSLSLK